MQKVHLLVRKAIVAVLDVFYPLFRRFMPLQTYHYAACGGSNTLLGLILFSLSYDHLFHGEVVHFGGIALEPHNAALGLSFLVTFPIGFYLSMYVVFQGSYLRRRVQLFRYFLVALGCIFLNYFGLRFFILLLGWDPILSQILNTVIVVMFSYFSQRYFSFRSPKVKAEQAEPATSLQD